MNTQKTEIPFYSYCFGHEVCTNEFQLSFGRYRNLETNSTIEFGEAVSHNSMPLEDINRGKLIPLYPEWHELYVIFKRKLRLLFKYSSDKTKIFDCLNFHLQEYILNGGLREKWLTNTEILIKGEQQSYLNETLIKWIRAEKLKNKSEILGYLDENKLDVFFDYLKSIFGNTPYELLKNQRGNEAFFHIRFHDILISSLGFEQIEIEKSLSEGRSDFIFKNEKYVYIFEFKSNMNKNQTPYDAIIQIKNKKYYEPYLSSNKKIILVGVVFNDKNIEDWKSEEYIY